MLLEAKGDATVSARVIEELENNYEQEQEAPAKLTKAEREKLKEANIRILPDPLDLDHGYDEDLVDEVIEADGIIQAIKLNKEWREKIKKLQAWVSGPLTSKTLKSHVKETLRKLFNDRLFKSIYYLHKWYCQETIQNIVRDCLKPMGKKLELC